MVTYLNSKIVFAVFTIVLWSYNSVNKSFFFLTVRQTEVTDLVVFEGQTVHLECTPTIFAASIRWTLNDSDISPDDGNNNINFMPEGLHHQLVIGQPTMADSGEYVCYIDTDVGRPALKTTTLTVIPGKDVIAEMCRKNAHIASHIHSRLQVV